MAQQRVRIDRRLFLRRQKFLDRGLIALGDPGLQFIAVGAEPRSSHQVGHQCDFVSLSHGRSPFSRMTNRDYIGKTAPSSSTPHDAERGKHQRKQLNGWLCPRTRGAASPAGLTHGRACFGRSSAGQSHCGYHRNGGQAFDPFSPSDAGAWRDTRILLRTGTRLSGKGDKYSKRRQNSVWSWRKTERLRLRNAARSQRAFIG